MNTKKYILAFIITFCTSLTAIAQQGDYMVHTIKQGETLSALAKQFNTTVGDVMRLNGMNSKSVLKIGEQIKIPVSSTTVTETVKVPVPQKAVAAPIVTAPPVVNTATHTVTAKESLYSIAKKYHVTVAQLKQWNKLPNENIKIDQVLVVGTEKAKTETLSTATVKPVADTVKKQKIVLTETIAPVVSIPTKPIADTVRKKIVVIAETTAVTIVAPPKEGYFKNEYVKTGKELQGDAATFKSASGWADGKYYVLMNNVDAGTIVRIKGNNKIIYAKVLGALPDIKEDIGLLLRLSNAAASVMGLTDSKFEVVVNY